MKRILVLLAIFSVNIFQAASSEGLLGIKTAYYEGIKQGEQIGAPLLSAFLRGLYFPSKGLLKNFYENREAVSDADLKDALEIVQLFLESVQRLSIRYDSVPELQRFDGYVFPELLGAAYVLAQSYNKLNNPHKAFEMHLFAGLDVSKHATSMHDLKIWGNPLLSLIGHLNEIYPYTIANKEIVKDIVLKRYQNWVNLAKPIKASIAKNPQNSDSIKRDAAYNRFKSDMNRSYMAILEIIEGEIESATTLQELEQLKGIIDQLIQAIGQNVNSKEINHLKGIFDHKYKKFYGLEKVQSFTASSSSLSSSSSSNQFRNNENSSNVVDDYQSQKTVSSFTQGVSKQNWQKAQQVFDLEAQKSLSISPGALANFYQYAYLPAMQIMKDASYYQRSEVDYAFASLLSFLMAQAKIPNNILKDSNGNTISLFSQFMKTADVLTTFYKQKEHFIGSFFINYFVGAHLYQKHQLSLNDLQLRLEQLGLMLDHLKKAWDYYISYKDNAIQQLKGRFIHVDTFKRSMHMAYDFVLNQLKAIIDNALSLNFEKEFWALVSKMKSDQVQYVEASKINALIQFFNVKKNQLKMNEAVSFSEMSSRKRQGGMQSHYGRDAKHTTAESMKRGFLPRKK